MRIGRRALCGLIENAGLVPSAFAPQDDIGIARQRDGPRVRRKLTQDFGIFVIGKDQLEILVHRMVAEPLPMANQPFLRMAIDFEKTFAPHDLDAEIQHAFRKIGGAETLQNADALELHEIREIADAHGACRFAVDPADNLRGAEIIAVELYGIGTLMYDHENRRADGKTLRQLVRTADNRHFNTHIWTPLRR